MSQSPVRRVRGSQLGGLIESAGQGAQDEAGSPAGSQWQGLNMERIARRLVQVARLATAQHAARRLREAMRRRDRSLERLVGDNPAAANDQDEGGQSGQSGAA